MHDKTNQLKFWGQLTQFKEHCFYLHDYLSWYESLDYYKNIVLAIGSSGSIAGWLIWNSIPWVWSGIIAFIQVLQAVSPHLTFKNKSEKLHRVSVEFDQLCIQMEESWSNVSDGKLTDEEILNMYFSYKRKIQAIMDSGLRDINLKECKKYLAEAKMRAEAYFHSQYAQGTSENV